MYVDSKKQTRVLHRGRTAVVGEKSEWFDLYRRDRETIPSGVRSDAIWSISNSQNKYFYKKINKRLFGFLATDGETDENQLHDLCPRIEIRQFPRANCNPNAPGHFDNRTADTVNANTIINNYYYYYYLLIVSGVYGFLFYFTKNWYQKPLSGKYFRLCSPLDYEKYMKKIHLFDANTKHEIRHESS